MQRLYLAMSIGIQSGPRISPRRGSFLHADSQTSGPSLISTWLQMGPDERSLVTCWAVKSIMMKNSPAGYRQRLVGVRRNQYDVMAHKVSSAASKAPLSGFCAQHSMRRKESAVIHAILHWQGGGPCSHIRDPAPPPTQVQ